MVNHTQQIQMTQKLVVILSYPKQHQIPGAYPLSSLPMLIPNQIPEKRKNRRLS
jgi:hypothetical protein